MVSDEKVSLFAHNCFAYKMFSSFQPPVSHTGNEGKKDRGAQVTKQREPVKGAVPSPESPVRERVFG